MNLPPGLRREGAHSSPRGRCLKATRPFEPGEIIAEFSTPNLVLSDSPSLHITCSYCLRADRPVRACTGCRCTYYCSTPCQKSDWSRVHKAECKVFKRVRAEGHGFLPTPVRALLQVLLRPDLKAAAAEMEGHAEASRSNGEEWKDMELQALASLHYLGQEATPQRVTETLQLLCKLQVNSFNRTDEDTGQTGIFANPALAMVNHSCMPNAFVQFNERKAILRANVAINEDVEIEISYIDCNLHRSHRQQALKERWHFDCACPRCKDNLDVYQVAQRYPHIKLNSLSINPDLTVSPQPSNTSGNGDIQSQIAKIYPACSRQPQRNPGPSGSREILEERWKLCQPLRNENLFAVEPVSQVMAEATIYFGEREEFPSSLAISCFLALNSDPIKSPMPFGPARIKGLLMLANILSNTAPISGSETSRFADDPLQGRIVKVLSKMDQATIAQAVLAIVVYWAPRTQSGEWQVHQEAGAQLKDIESLPGREKEKMLIRSWVEDQADVEAAMFFEYAVIKPLKELARFALEVMDAQFGVITPGKLLGLTN